MEGENTKLLLVSANIGSIFEDPDHMLKIWLREFLLKVQAMEPGMLAIHCQEVGGKDYEVSMQHVNHFVKAMLGSEELTKYDRARVFLDEDYTAADKFTALGNLYFIHESVEDVLIFDFIECKFLPVEGREVLSGNIENIQIKEKAKFPQNFFPDFKWSRKGFLRTRWSVNNCVFDLVNIHLFHDASNIIAMQKSPSIYSENRFRALAHTLQRFETDQFEKVPFFLFGDFNFRLDLKSLLKEMTEKTEQHEVRGKKDQISKLSYSDANKKTILTLESKYFDHHENHNEVFSNKERSLNKYDREFSMYADKLYEFDIDFPPSYPFSEDVNDGMSYMRTRCPSWCDRVLLSNATKDIVHMDDDHRPQYQIIGQEVCMGDHKPVFLSLLLKKGKGNESSQLQTQTSLERRKKLTTRISINGEEVDWQADEINIHDFTQFEREEDLHPEFKSSRKRRGGSELQRQQSQDQSGNLSCQHSVDGPAALTKKTPSFQDIARQVVLMENALLRWPRRSRSRHHSSSSEDGLEDDGPSADTVSVNTNISQLSDADVKKIDLGLNNNSAHGDDETRDVQGRKHDVSKETYTNIEKSSDEKKTILHEHAKTEAASKSSEKPPITGRKIRCPCVVL